MLTEFSTAKVKVTENMRLLDAISRKSALKLFLGLTTLRCKPAKIQIAVNQVGT